jgi:hypothetical protein
VSFTLSTVPLSLLAIYLCYRSQWQILPVMMFMSVFQAASLLNLMGGGIGVGPGYALLLVTLVKTCVFDRNKPQPRKTSSAAAIFLVLFTLYAGTSAFINPWLFYGVPYTNPKIGFNVPLRWETGHLNQLFYLILSVALFFVVSRRCSLAELQRSVRWFVGGCVLASVIAIYQYTCLRTGLPFPSDFLYTNTSYGTFSAYEIGRFARINSTFVEASAAGLFFPPAMALTAWRMVIRPNWKDAVYSLVILTGLYLTISTTAYLCFFFLACLSVFILFRNWKARSSVRMNKLVLSAGICILFVGLMAMPSARTWTSDLLNTVIFGKTQTFSYEQRTEMNDDAVQTAASTSWLGAGWGVCRASSLVPTMLGNVGVPGVALFAAFLAQVFLPLWRAKRQSLVLKRPAIFAASVVLVGLLVAGPELTNPPLWVFAAIATTTFTFSTRGPMVLAPLSLGRKPAVLSPEVNQW